MSAQPIIDGPIVDHPLAETYHQRWFIIDDAGQQLSVNDMPALATLTLAITYGCLVLRAPGMLRLDIVLDVIEDDDSVLRQACLDGQHMDVIDEGDLAAAWLSNLLQQQCRLVKVHPDSTLPSAV